MVSSISPLLLLELHHMHSMNPAYTEQLVVSKKIQFGFRENGVLEATRTTQYQGGYAVDFFKPLLTKGDPPASMAFEK